MLKKIFGILTASAICAASAAQAHQVHYAMAAAETRPVMQPLPNDVFTALAGEARKAQAAALAKCRKAGKRTCIVIGSGTLPHPRKH